MCGRGIRLFQDTQLCMHTCVDSETAQRSTPRMPATVRSILPLQAAHDIPPTAKVNCCLVYQESGGGQELHPTKLKRGRDAMAYYLHTCPCKPFPPWAETASVLTWRQP